MDERRRDLHICTLQSLVDGLGLHRGHALVAESAGDLVDDDWADQVSVCQFLELGDYRTLRESACFAFLAFTREIDIRIISFEVGKRLVETSYGRRIGL